ncbi:MAG: hypothetical protein KC485_07555, partial [Gemmatimonadetes bacterium]|nr:hypothetical protein [Gemmatimonadota bacterium]
MRARTSAPRGFGLAREREEAPVAPGRAVHAAFEVVDEREVVGRERVVGRAAQRAFEHLARVGEPAAVATEHLDIGEQVMAERDR